MNIEKYKFRFQIVKLLDSGFYTAMNAAWELNLTVRHVRRLLVKYRLNKQKKGKLSLLILAPKSRLPTWNGKTQDIIDETIRLKKENPGRSNQRLAELIQDKFLTKISRCTIRNILIRHDCYEKAKRERRTFMNLEENITHCGQMVQFDVCEGAWLNGYRRVYLIAFMDAYSRYIVGWQWVKANTAWNNILVLRSVALKYGVPDLFYTDNASFYKVIRHNQSIYQNHKPEDHYETTIQRIILDLGSVMVNHRPYQPQGKGRLERFFRFMQDRFIKEHTASNLKGLNKQFDVWSKWYNNRHKIRTTQSVPKDRFNHKGFKPVPKDLNLEQVFSYQYTRKVDKYNGFSFEGTAYIIDPANCEHFSGSLSGCNVQLYVSEEKVIVFHHDRRIQEFARIKAEDKTNGSNN